MSKKPNKDLETFLEKFKKGKKRPKFAPNVWVRNDVHLISLVLENVPSYHEPIDHEPLASLHRACDDKRVVGVTLYLKKDIKKVKLFENK